MPVYSVFSKKKYKKSEILFISCKSYHVIVIKSILIFSLVSITNFYPHWLLPTARFKLGYFIFVVRNKHVFQAKCLQLPSKKKFIAYCTFLFYFYVPESDMLWIWLLILFVMPSSTSRYYVKNKFWSSIRIKLIISDWLLIIRKVTIRK